MSVRVRDRKPSMLDAQVKMEELVKHTIHIVSNQNVFDPQYEKFHGLIVETALVAGCDMWEANGIRVRGAEDYALRRSLQDEAIRKLNVLLYLMTIARKLDHLRRKKYEHWVGLATSTRDMARKWRDSDAKRHSRLESGM